MEFSEIFRLANLAVAGIAAVSGAFWILSFSWNNLILGLYLIAFGGGIGLLEFQIPPQATRFASFLFSFLGRGVFYFFLGAIIADGMILFQIMGGITGLIGLVYIALEFFPVIEPPSNMREVDAGWGAEGV
ncbi:hypothetical protein Cpir12675_006125 [Ceratocystis pirilliformis]|uniref:Golgi apparatus membrane protein tvp15 n=1 Tax=Ceratocystis pirilliformis TaxID=259994 RepID=A0ABR3YJS4_9PEZI